MATHRLQPRPFALAVAGLLTLTLGLTACKSAPVGDRGGRIDPYETTSADKGSTHANMPSLLEFSDQVAQYLIQDIVDTPEITGFDTKAILELGDLENRTRTYTDDFVLVQRRIRNQLLQSNVIRNQFVVVESGSRMDLERARVSGRTTEGAARYDPTKTFILSGDFMESRRGDAQRFYFSFQLVNLDSRQIVRVYDYDLGQQRE